MLPSTEKLCVNYDDAFASFTAFEKREKCWHTKVYKLNLSQYANNADFYRLLAGWMEAAKKLVETRVTAR